MSPAMYLALATMIGSGWDRTFSIMVRHEEDTMSRLTPPIAMVLLVLAAVACSSETASKAGGDEPPIVLTIGTNDSPDRPASGQIEEFAARVAELSEGEVTVKPVFRVGGVNTPNWDQEVARQVVNGELDMGNIPSRAFDVLGVTSLQALNAPFLITTEELLNEVVASDLAERMLAGPENVGLVGLVLLPEGLRRPFGFDGGLLGPRDYEGGVIRAPASATTSAVFEALGATVVDDEIDPGSQIGMESAYLFDPLGTATANVVFFPKVNVLVVNADVYARLNESQKEVLEQAASETRNWSIESRVSETAAAEEWCRNGGRVVTADGDALAALQVAVEPVYQHLRADQLTAELIDQIEDMKKSIPDFETVVPDACTGEREDSEPTAQGTDDPSVINGSYRFEWSADELAEAWVELIPTEGPDAPDPEELRAAVEEIIRPTSADNAGVVSLIFTDGFYSQIWETGFFAGDHCNGTYTIAGNRITMVASSDPKEYQCGDEDLGAVVVDAAWELTEQGLVLSDFILSEEPGVTWFTQAHFSKPLTRVD